jgi:dihydrofolate synthase / folylpolyglutamate synthase
MNYPEAVQYIYSLGNEILTAKLGLENIQTLLRYLGDPHQHFPSILIAGTNGKGSVAAFTESILRCSGSRTGLYTSPHLCRIEERIRVVGKEISQQEFALLTGRVKDAVESMMGASSTRNKAFRLERHPTYFEIVTAIAFQHFANCQVDLAVLEVGLGGKYDATNVVDPLVTIISNVDFDHQQFLGNSLDEIAEEKAGIIKPHSSETRVLPVNCDLEKTPAPPVVYGGNNPVVDAVLNRQCRQTGARLIHVQSEMRYQVRSCGSGRYQVELESQPCGQLLLDLPLPGRHQVFNALAAVRCVEILGQSGYPVSREQIQLGISRTQWPGRLEVVESKPRLVLDGAHNPAAAETVRHFLEEVAEPDTTVMVFAVMRDKALQSMARILFPMARHILLPRLESERASIPQFILEALPEFTPRLQVMPHVTAALDLARKLAPERGTVVVVGSLYLVGEVLKVLDKAGRAGSVSGLLT